MQIFFFNNVLWFTETSSSYLGHHQLPERYQLDFLGCRENRTYIQQTTPVFPRSSWDLITRCTTYTHKQKEAWPHTPGVFSCDCKISEIASPVTVHCTGDPCQMCSVSFQAAKLAPLTRPNQPIIGRFEVTYVAPVEAPA